MKLAYRVGTVDADRSLPSRGAWIEIYVLIIVAVLVVLSLPSRGAWIEIHRRNEKRPHHQVAPLTGSVD